MKEISFTYEEFLQMMTPFNRNDRSELWSRDLGSVSSEELRDCEVHAIEDIVCYFYAICGLIPSGDIREKASFLIRKMDADPTLTVISDGGVSVTLVANKNKTLIEHLVTAPSGLPNISIRYREPFHKMIPDIYRQFSSILVDGKEFTADAIIITGFKTITYERVKKHNAKRKMMLDAFRADRNCMSIELENLDGYTYTLDRPDYYNKMLDKEDQRKSAIAVTPSPKPITVSNPKTVH